MHKFRRCIVSNNSAKEARLLHGCNLALLGLTLCTTLLAGAHPLQTDGQIPASGVLRTEVLSYEGQNVSSVELAGRPDLKQEELLGLVTQHAGEAFSTVRIDASLNALKRTGRFQDVHLDLRPELDGVRVMFVLQPAVYFGMYQFPGAEKFAYSRLLQVSNYAIQEPYSPVDVQKAKESLTTFFRRNGYFQPEVQPEVRTDAATGLANVDFHVKLNPPAKFGDVEISGATPEETEHLRNTLRSLRARLRMAAIRKGKTYSLKRLQNATQYLEGHLQKENHLAAQVRLIGADYNPETNRADIRFEVKPGPIVHAKVEGAHLWGWTKHKLLPIYQQNGLTPELIQEGRQNLLTHFRQKGFFDVEVSAEIQTSSEGVTVLYRVMKGERKRIQDVAFTGNESINVDELRKHVSVDDAGFLSRGRYSESSIKTLKAFYQSKGFNQVRVTPRFATRNGKNVVVTFVVEEGPQDIVQSFGIEGLDTVTEKEIAPDGLRLAPGQPYSQKAVDDDRNKIMSQYLERGYLTATFRTNANPLPNDPHKFDVVYSIIEGPQVHTRSIVTLGRTHTDQTLIRKDLQSLQAGQPITEGEILASESRLYTRGIFDWAQVNPRRPVTSQTSEDLIVKVHEAKRNSITYGFGFEAVNRGGSVPTGTVALPGLPPVGLPSTFKTSERTIKGPRANFQYTRSNVRGKAETITIGMLGGPLEKRVSFVFTDPNFRWTTWTANLTATGEYTRENPIFTTRLAQFGFQLQRPLDAKKTQNLFLRYTMTRTGLRDLLIPEILPEMDFHTRLSTISATYIRDTRDNPLDARKGTYQSVEVDLNPVVLGSNANFGKALAQAAYYRDVHSGIVWANSLRLGLLVPSGRSRIPLSQRFFTGGGSTLRGFPLNGSGPQRSIPACGNPADTSTCAFIRVPTGGVQMVILNSELRIPFPLKKGLGFVTFYDGGNVYDKVRFRTIAQNFTHSAGIGFRYATPVGPIRVDLGRNLNRMAGINATQIFITLGQAF